MSLQERFTSYLGPATETGCIPWTGYTMKSGYGMLNFRFAPKTKPVALYSHRLAWEFANGPIPDGLFVCHRCDQPSCCNPEHMFLGTNAENSRDRDSKGRQAKGERSGPAKLTADVVRLIRSQYATGTFRQCDLAREHGVSPAAILHIVSRRTWKHLE